MNQFAVLLCGYCIFPPWRFDGREVKLLKFVSQQTGEQLAIRTECFFYRADHEPKSS